MSQFNQVGNPKFSGLLQRLLWMKQAVAPAPTLAPEIAPVLDVNQQDDPAMLFLRGERLCEGTIVNFQNIGLNNIAGIQNPGGSGMLVTVTGWEVFPDVPSLIFLERNDAPSSLVGAITNTSKRTMDGRWWVSGTNELLPTARLYENTRLGATLAGSFGFLVFTAGNATQGARDQRIVLRPGQVLQFVNGTVDTDVQVSRLYWTERPLAAEEQTN
jgi:hypothetical protein